MRSTLRFWFAASLTGIGPLNHLPGAHGAEYSWEISGEADRLEIADIVEIDTLAAGATYYSRPVDDTRGPYALAPFLNRSSCISATASQSDEQFESVVYSPFTGPIVRSLERDSAGYALSGRYVWQQSGWYVGASTESADTDWPSSEFSMTDSELSGYGVIGGRYFGETTAVELGFRSATTTLDIMQAARPDLFAFPLPAISSRNETEIEDFGLSVLHVGELGSMRYSVSGQVHSSRAELTAFALTSLPPSASRPPPVAGVAAIAPEGVAIRPWQNPIVLTQDRIQSYGLAAELFPTVALGLRVGYARWDDDPAQDDSYELTATWFFKRSVAARISFARARRDLPASGLRDSDSIALTMLGRF